MCSLTSLDLSNFDTSHVFDMCDMFNGCSSLEELNLSGFDMSDVVSFAGMFKDCVCLEDVNATGISLDKIVEFDFPKGTYLDSEMLTKKNTVLPVRIDYSGNDNWNVSWADGEGYKAGSTSMNRSDIEERMQAVEKLKVSKLRDISLVGNGQVLGDLPEVSKNTCDLGE